MSDAALTWWRLAPLALPAVLVLAAVLAAWAWRARR